MPIAATAPYRSERRWFEEVVQHVCLASHAYDSRDVWRCTLVQHKPGAWSRVRQLLRLALGTLSACQLVFVALDIPLQIEMGNRSSIASSERN